MLYYSTDVAWFRGPTLLEDNADNVEIWRQRDRHFLRLYDIQNSSFYSCTALNTLGEVTHHFRLGLRKGKKNICMCQLNFGMATFSKVRNRCVNFFLLQSFREAYSAL